MAFVFKDKHGIFVKFKKQIIRPVPNSCFSKDDYFGTGFEHKDTVVIKKMKKSQFLYNVGHETWFLHGAYSKDRKSEDIFDPPADYI